MIGFPLGRGAALQRFDETHAFFTRLLDEGGRATVITPKSHSMSEAVAIMTGAAEPPPMAA